MLEWSTYIHNKGRRKGGCSKTGNYAECQIKLTIICLWHFIWLNPSKIEHSCCGLWVLGSLGRFGFHYIIHSAVHGWWNNQCQLRGVYAFLISKRLKSHCLYGTQKQQRNLVLPNNGYHLTLFCYKRKKKKTLPLLCLTWGWIHKRTYMLQAIGAGRASGLDAKVEEKQDICDQDS